MTEEILAITGNGQVDIQVGGPGNKWDYFSPCATMAGPTVPEGGTEIRWCQDPQKAGGFLISSMFQTAPDQITGSLTSKLGSILHLKKLRCRVSLRARYTTCAEREDVSQYNPLMLTYVPAKTTEHSYGDLVVTDPANTDEVIVTHPWSALKEYYVTKIYPTRLGAVATVGDQLINDLEVCDQASCDDACAISDGCSKLWGVTNADAAPYAAANLIKGVKTDGIWTLTATPILGLNGNVQGIECAGVRLVVSSNADSAVAYNDSPPDQDEWQVVVLANAPSVSPHALFMRTAREGYVGCVGGYTYKTIDGGLSWFSLLTNQWTAQNILSVHAHTQNLVYAAGNAGVLLRSDNGGGTWTNITNVATYGNVNILKVVVPPMRPQEVYIGTNNGKIWRSKDKGATFTQMRFHDDGVGTVDDLRFSGPWGGNNLYILHNDAGPRARILRDLSGGAGGADVEIIMDQTTIVPTGVELNALAVCEDPNVVFAGGALYGGYPVLIEAS